MLSLLNGPQAAFNQPSGAKAMILTDVFERWKAVSGLCQPTYRRYLSALHVLAAHGVVTVAHACELPRIARYIETRLKAGKNVRTVLGDMAALTGLLSYLRRAGELEAGVVEAVRELVPKHKKPRKRRAVVLPDTDFERLRQAAAHEQLYRLELMLMIVRFCGLRTMECLLLKREHIDLEKRRLHVESGKTGERFIPICRELRVFFEGRLPPSGFLFPSSRTVLGVLTDEGLRGNLRRAADRAEIARIDFRILRRTRETRWREAGVPADLVAEWMGHDVDVGDRFYTSISQNYHASCETPDSPTPAREHWSELATPVTKARPQGATTTIPLTPDELARMQAAERALVRAAKKGRLA